jgi:hypothetical protein
MERIKLYPPGGGVPVVPQPGQIENMKRNGWTEKSPKPKKEVK